MTATGTPSAGSTCAAPARRAATRLDEYPPVEQSDLAEVIAWLAEQEWCDGQVGMWGTSYSGFNSLQMACEQPPALKAICAIYATDDRWTDDVHWRGGALRLVDQVDYNHYMTPMCVLPPVPAVWGQSSEGQSSRAQSSEGQSSEGQSSEGQSSEGQGWEDEWRRRLATNEPWILTWLRESRHGSYWDHGSVRLGGSSRGYERITIPTLIVAGWADGYRNATFRLVEQLAGAGTPHRLLAGPWAHADASTAMPGPRIDFDAELAGWFDLWLRRGGVHEDGTGHADACDVFVRESTRPEPDLDLHEGHWLRLPSVPPVSADVRALPGLRTLAVLADVGTAAWIDCAGHLPWGLSGDQRLDDARSLTWDLAPPSGDVVGHPVARLRVSASAPAASLSVKLTDVFPDGTSALVSRGTLDLAFRDGVHGAPAALVPGQQYDVEVVLDACAYSWSPGQVLGSRSPVPTGRTRLPLPRRSSLPFMHGEVSLPVLDGSHPAPVFGPGAEHTSESAEGIGWSIEDDVLARRTTARTVSVSEYATPYDGRAVEDYRGEVWVDRRTFAQGAHAVTTYDLSWPGSDAERIEIRVRSVMDLAIVDGRVDVTIDTWATRDGVEVSHRRWEEQAITHPASR